jgi:hypothetical protein
VGECLFGSESEESSPDSEFDSDNELDDCTLLDVVVNGDSDEDDEIIQDFLWAGVNNYKGQKENFMGCVGSQGAAKQVTEIVDIFKLFFNKELTDKILEETNRYTKQFLLGHKLSSKPTTRAWKPVTEGEIYVLLGPIMLIGIVQKPTKIIFHHKKGNFHTRIWRHCNKIQTETNL